MPLWRCAAYGAACVRRAQLAKLRLEHMNTDEAKLVVETALLTAEQPLSVSDLRRLFNDELNADTVRVLLDELRLAWNGRGLELVSLASGWRFKVRRRCPYLERLNPERPPKYSRAGSRLWRSLRTGNRLRVATSRSCEE